MECETQGMWRPRGAKNGGGQRASCAPLQRQRCQWRSRRGPGARGVFDAGCFIAPELRVEVCCQMTVECSFGVDGDGFPRSRLSIQFSSLVSSRCPRWRLAGHSALRKVYVRHRRAKRARTSRGRSKAGFQFLVARAIGCYLDKLVGLAFDDNPDESAGCKPGRAPQKRERRDRPASRGRWLLWNWS